MNSEQNCENENKVVLMIKSIINGLKIIFE